MIKRRMLALTAAAFASALGLSVAQPAPPAQAQTWAHYAQFTCGSQYVQVTFSITKGDSRWGYGQTGSASGSGVGQGAGYFTLGQGTHTRNFGVHQMYLMRWASPGEGTISWRCVPQG